MPDVKIELDGLDIRKVLELSTSHLTQEAAQWCHGKCTMENEFGFFFNVRDAETAECHAHVSRILSAAAALNFDYVWFDRDAEVCSSLDRYDW